MIQGITCRGRPTVGLRLVPTAQAAPWDGYAASEIRWEWRSEDSELLAKTRSFTPQEA